ncbi:unnamed protein product [Symbiodinium natans]|uniref:Uncharacterized protein n=1 Tax=Symbiodinium natans TaxID=878477 RepID=A0A812T041_9DINO|nr:unnamed protein product [Symbiodinium natans]
MAERDGDTAVSTGLDATRGMHLSKQLPYPIWSDQALGGISIMDLPMTELGNTNTLLKHFVDVITNVPPPDKNTIESLINAGKWNELPPPFCPKQKLDVKLVLQFAVLPLTNGNVCIVKHVQSPDLKLTKSVVDTLCHGTPHVLNWHGRNAYDFKKAWQWFFEQLGGWQCRCYSLSAVVPHQEKASKQGYYLSTLSEEDVDKGFAFIEQEAGNLASEWKRVQWITKNLHVNQDSPIFQWPISTVEKSIRAIQTDGVLALPVENFFFTLADLDYQILKFGVNPILKTMTTHAVGVVGGPGSGKTPLARIIALCASRFWKREQGITSPPSYREASEFDFFRGHPGRKDRPDIHDDGRLAEEPIRKMKGFTDVGCTMLTKERWGAAKFVQGQMRVFVCNDYDSTEWIEKHQNIRAGTVLQMPHEQFLEVVSPVFPKDTKLPHIMAVLKRANVLVNAGNLVIFRRASQEENRVPCLVLQTPVDYLKTEAQQRYMLYRENKLVKPASFEDDVAWEARYLDAVLHDKVLPLPNPTIINDAQHRLFHDEPRPPAHRDIEAAAPSSLPAVPSVPKAVAVKKESVTFRRALSSLQGHVIDLDSPPKKALRAGYADVKTEISDAANEPASPTSLMAAPVPPSKPSSPGSMAAPISPLKPPSQGSSMDIHDPMDDLSHEEGLENLSQELADIIDQQETD